MTMRTSIVDRPIDVAQVLNEASDPDGGHGAAVLFVGTVRNVNDAKAVTGIDYSAYREMAERELGRIADDATVKFPGVSVVIEHRIGTLTIGEASVAIATGHAHRGPAHDANRFVIEELKRRLPVWKREHYVDGTREWVGQDAAPSPAGAAR
jgi:molybdopterin synthase catalytic subunit